MNIIDKYFTSKRKLKNQIRDFKMHTALLTSALRDEGSHAKRQYEIRLEGERHHQEMIVHRTENSKLQLRVYELQGQIMRSEKKPTPPIPTLRGIRTDRIDAIISLDTEIVGGVYAVELMMQGGHKVTTMMDAQDIERYVNKVKGNSQ